MKSDREIIEQIGVANIAKMLGFSLQRVSNWSKRGIPADVILDNADFASLLSSAGYVRRKRH